ncbi:MAG: hypothetical protein IJ991_13380 [Thermoguttaceae bacterium]|nr:hypothetical protein [Thermoguttaceae bacterium]
MSRRLFVNAAGVAAIAAATSAFFVSAPTFAAELSQEPTSTAETSQEPTAEEIMKSDDPYAAIGFNEELLDVPDGKPARFYDDRLALLFAERLRCDVQLKNRYARDAAASAKPEGFCGTPSVNVSKAALPPFGCVLHMGDARLWRPAKPGTVSARTLDVVLRASLKVAESQELDRMRRDEGFRAHIDAQTAIWQNWPRETRRFLLQKLAEVESKTPVDLGRAVFLRERLELAEQEVLLYFYRTESNVGAPRLVAADVEKLLDVPKGESAEFYRARLADIRETLLLVDGSLVADKQGLGAFEEPLNDASTEVSHRLADADDATPPERFAHFQRAVARLANSGAVDRLQDVAEQEAARDAVDATDEARTPCVELAILSARLRNLETAASATGRGLRSPEAQAEWSRIEIELLERVDDGEIAWKLGGSWARVAEDFAGRVANLDLDVAARFRNDFGARLAAAQKATE